ncbi:hypothetical protein G4H71_04145 [Rhodococcus triatomae]|uniref:Membrane protein involved in the export of O-antigen and teichoic acid n=1 Tax=Rhodococcus triatomae TaxID=300028 RepID=A0A1G7ZMI3_9NOCA|nr:hypothetical protein [Rhodococcus triatomae]QNG18004.1 hypothetical protein G4H72_03895 [Rhodococcus triatomae]QNG22327.1 hypothetical protein G4H71_04145 [Rhodococcus triatomae]SDH09766.1 Membrane protein involved in the export of O-antigen and teichoic acid [Rhodococcus triatomae]
MTPTLDTPRRRRFPDTRSLEFDSGALVVAGLANGALGLVFWAVAARMFPESEVGRAGAVINTAVMLATVSNLSFGPMYERFLPQSGYLSRRMIVGGQCVTGVLALAVGAGFVLVGPSDRLFHSTLDAVLFPVYVMVLAGFALADSILIGLRGGRWAAVKNVFHAAAKLAVVAALGAGAVGGTDAMILAWLVPAAVAVLVVQAVVVVAGRGLPRSTAPRLPGMRALWAYFGGAYGITVLASVTPLVLPLVVVVSVGTEGAAYFTVVWSLVAAIMLGTGMVTGPFIAAAAAEPERLAVLLRRFLRLYAVVACAGAAALAVGGPIALWIVGQSYADNGATLVRLMALVQLASVPATVFGVLCRVHRTLRYAVAIQLVSTVGVVAVSLWAVPHWGVDGVGYTFLAVELVVVAAVAVPLYRRVRTDLGEKR